MEYKKDVKKIDFLNIPKEEQVKVLREALSKGQEEQMKLEKQYHKLLTQKACC
ncbi:MAG: hypothetical protein WC823_05505 [Parcubacteria group bacterium]|jgi:hypothetical protein